MINSSTRCVNLAAVRPRSRSSDIKFAGQISEPVPRGCGGADGDPAYASYPGSSQMSTLVAETVMNCTLIGQSWDQFSGIKLFDMWTWNVRCWT